MKEILTGLKVQRIADLEEYCSSAMLVKLNCIFESLL